MKTQTKERAMTYNKELDIYEGRDHDLFPVHVISRTFVEDAQDGLLRNIRVGIKKYWTGHQWSRFVEDAQQWRANNIGHAAADRMSGALEKVYLRDVD